MTEETQADPQVGEAGEATQAAAEPKVFDAEYVAKLRREAAAYRKEANDFKAKVTEYESARMSESEKLAAQAKAAQEAAAQAQGELRKTRAEAALAKAAAKAGVDVDLVGRLVEVQFDDGGQPTGVEASLAEVLTKWPHLKAASATPGATNPGRKAPLTLAEVKKMGHDEINSRWDEVQKVLAGSK